MKTTQLSTNEMAALTEKIQNKLMAHHFTQKETNYSKD
jgi:hypothetical protein